MNLGYMALGINVGIGSTSIRRTPRNWDGWRGRGVEREVVAGPPLSDTC